MLTLPNEIIEHIYQDLALSDLSRLSCTSMHLYEYIKKDEKVQKLKYQRFILLFGMLASCDTHIPLDTLANRIRKSCQLSLSSENQIVLMFDDQGFPYLKPSTNKLDIPKFETIARQMDVIIINNQKVYDELLKQPWNIDDPLQDYRNRIIRFKCMHREMTNLRQAFEVTFPEIKQVTYLTKHRLASTYDIKRNLCAKLTKENRAIDLNEEILHRIVSVPCLSSSQFMTMKKFRRVLGVTDIMVNGHKMSVNIVAKPINDTSELIIQLIDENKQSFGEMKIFRKLYKDLESLERDKLGDGISEENILQFSKSSFDVMALCIYPVRVHNFRDAQTGYRPFLRLLAQVAIEIFSCEPVRRLLIHAVADHKDDYALMGFGSTDDNFNRHRDEILDFRAQTRQMFLMGEEQSSYIVYMDKMEYSEEHKTRYFKKLDKKMAVESALIECDPQETITWEEQIRRKPVLNSFSGPLFWEKW